MCQNVDLQFPIWRIPPETPHVKVGMEIEKLSYLLKFGSMWLLNREHRHPEAVAFLQISAVFLVSQQPQTVCLDTMVRDESDLSMQQKVSSCPTLLKTGLNEADRVVCTRGAIILWHKILQIFLKEKIVSTKVQCGWNCCQACESLQGLGSQVWIQYLESEMPDSFYSLKNIGQ